MLAAPIHQVLRPSLTPPPEFHTRRRYHKPNLCANRTSIAAVRGTQGLLISGHMVYLITSLHRVDFGYFGGRASAFEIYAKIFPLPITANLGKSLGKSVFP